MEPIEQVGLERKVIRVSRRKLIIAIIAIAVIAIGSVIVGGLTQTTGRYRGSSSNSLSSMPSVSGPGMPSSDYNKRFTYPGSQPTIDDTREFLKTNYSATVQTRDVSQAVKNVKSAVRDAEGRVDTFTSSTKSGYVSFVVPKSKFDSFQEEVSKITNAKLYTETISSVNLLTEKQSIEQRADSAAAYLANLEKQKQDLADKHTRTVNSINASLSSIRSQLAGVQAEMENTDDPAVLNSLNTQEANLAAQEDTLKDSLATENRNYASQSASLATQITQAKSGVDAVDRQDTQFTNKIETVSGYVSVNWISFWEMSKIYSPIHPTIIIIVVLIVAWYILYRRGYLPIIALT